MDKSYRNAIRTLLFLQKFCSVDKNALQLIVVSESLSIDFDALQKVSITLTKKDFDSLSGQVNMTRGGLDKNFVFHSTFLFHI